MNYDILHDLVLAKEKVGVLQTVLVDARHMLEQAHKEINDLRQELEGKNYELEMVKMELEVLKSA